MPAFTIITVCLNIASTIRRTCESIVNQTFQDFQWIVVDGASTDGTLDILKEYSSRINILISEPDKGIYNAMNKGIKLATGEYINFMNGGDEFYNNAVLQKVVDTEPTADVIYGDIMVNTGKTLYLHRNQRLLCPKSLYKQTISHPASFVKRSIMLRYRFDESFKIAADYDFFTKIYFRKKYTFKRLDITIAIFYLDGISSTNIIVTQQENTKIRLKYYCFIQRYKFDKQVRKDIADKISFYKMVATHPRYIAGWIKRKILGIIQCTHKDKSA